MSLLRLPLSSAIAIALASGQKLWSADLFQFTLVDGVTVFSWTSFDQPIAFGGATYLTSMPKVSRSKWSVANTMQVTSLDVIIGADNSAFNGGAQFKTQVHNGLFNGATMTLARLIIGETSPGSGVPNITAPIGSVVLFGGVVGPAKIVGNKVTLTCKSKTNLLDQYAPRNTYSLGCSHNFCDVNCTLNAASFTASYTVGSGASVIFVPWSGSPPGNYAFYENGEITFTSGACDGETATIMNGDTSGLNLAYPLNAVPAIGDSFSALQGCDKTYNTCLNTYNNLQHRRAFDFVPPPDTTY